MKARVQVVGLVLSIVIGLSLALPPFEIRSASDQKSEGATEWIAHLRKAQACKESTEARPTFLCHSTRSWQQPECVYAQELCDGRSDCPQGEDERKVLCSKLADDGVKAPWSL